MLQHDYLFESGGLLSMGTKAEKVFGKKNFLELYAVFSTPVLYRVHTETGRDLGSLEQNFVDRLVDDMSCFLLGGRAWMVLSVNHEEKIVRVQGAPRGKKPSWGGFIPQHLGFEVCQKMAQVLMDDTQYAFVDERGLAAINEWRGDLGELLKRDADNLQQDDKGVMWWSFAGGRINHTLKYALEWKEGWKIVADNFSLRISGKGVSGESVRKAIDGMRADGFWDDQETREKLLAKVPEYRLSKFQRALPPKFEVEMVGDYLLDFEGTKGFVRGDV